MAENASTSFDPPTNDLRETSVRLIEVLPFKPTNMLPNLAILIGSYVLAFYVAKTLAGYLASYWQVDVVSIWIPTFLYAIVINKIASLLFLRPTQNKPAQAVDAYQDTDNCKTPDDKENRSQENLETLKLNLNVTDKCQIAPLTKSLLEKQGAGAAYRLSLIGDLSKNTRLEPFGEVFQPIALTGKTANTLCNSDRPPQKVAANHNGFVFPFNFAFSIAILCLSLPIFALHIFRGISDGWWHAGPQLYSSLTLLMLALYWSWQEFAGRTSITIAPSGFTQKRTFNFLDRQFMKTFTHHDGIIVYVSWLHIVGAARRDGETTWIKMKPIEAEALVRAWLTPSEILEYAYLIENQSDSQTDDC